MLSRYRWDWFGSFTFRDLPPTFTAHRRFRAFIRHVERAAGVPVAYFRADEYGERLGKFHLHALVMNVGNLRRMDWLDEWNRRHGFARIFEYDPTKGAAFYIAKYVAKQLGDWEFSENIDVLTQNQPALLVASTGRKPDVPAQVPAVSKNVPKKPDRNAQGTIRDYLEDPKPRPVSFGEAIYEYEVHKFGRNRRRQWF